MTKREYQELKFEIESFLDETFEEDFEIEVFDEVRYELDEEEAIIAKLCEWLRTHDSSDENYSDIYKDVYGVRPR